jgi:hypothetical protein
MKRTVGFFLVLVCIGSMGSGLVAAEPATREFGYGAVMAMAFFPDMTGINTFMSENGLPPMGDALIGMGGGGRGGVIGGPAFGGMGWGVLATSESEDRSAELVFAAGGLDLGAAVGGDEGSVLTMGVVLGGGANILSLTGPPGQTEAVTPGGIVPGPMHRELRLIVGFVQPYVSMAAQLLPWMGFEFRFGYVLPLLGIEYGDLPGIPAPSLELAGPTVSLGFAFGGIGTEPEVEAEAEEERAPARVTAVSEGSFVVAAGDELAIENALGDVAISAYAVEDVEVADLVVEWQAARTCKARRIDELQVVFDATDAGASLKTVGSGRVDYVLRVPIGVDLRVRNGAGNVTLVGHEAPTIIIENGVGDVNLNDVSATALIVSGGVGRIDLPDVDAQQLIAELGVGDIALTLPASASAKVTAKTGIGDVTIARFPGMIGGTHGLIGKSGDVTLGDGERTIELNVRLGGIDIEMGGP